MTAKIRKCNKTAKNKQCKELTSFLKIEIVSKQIGGLGA